MAWADPRAVSPRVDLDSAQLTINLDDIFALQETHHHVITKDLNYDGLQKALRWVVHRVENMPAAPDEARVGMMEGQLKELLGENLVLKDKLKALEQQQEDLAQQLDDAKRSKDQDRPSAAPATASTPAHDAGPAPEPRDLGPLMQKLDILEARLSRLENRPQPDTVEGPVSHAGDSHADQRLAALEKAMEKLAAGVHDAESAAARAAAAAAEAQRAAQEERDAAPAPAAPLVVEVRREDLQGLQSSLESQLEAQLEQVQAQVEVLRSRLNDKADRSELDSVMQGPISQGASSAEGPQAGIEGEASIIAQEPSEPYVTAAPDEPFDAEALIDAVNRAGAEVRALRNRVTVLQERLKKKADQTSIDELRQQLVDAMAKVKKDIKDMRADVLEVKSGSRVVEVLEGAVQEMMKRLASVEREQRRAAMERERERQEKAELPALPEPSVVYVQVPSDPGPEGQRPEDLEGQIQELYKLLGSKANATDVAALIMHIRDMASKVEEIKATAAAASVSGGAGGSSVPASPRVGRHVLAPAGSEPNSPHWGSSAGVAATDRLEHLEAALSSLQDAVALKADAEAVAAKADTEQLLALGNKVAGVVVDLAGKAERSAIDELRLRMALLGDVEHRPAAGSAGAGEQATSDTAGLLQMLQGMLSRKAGQEELDALKELLEAKAGRSDLEALSARMAAIPPPAAPVVIQRQSTFGQNAAGFASRDDLSTLATQVGDLYAELERQRRELARVPKEAPLMAMLSDQSPSKQAGHGHGSHAHGHHQPSADTMKLINAMAKELQDLKDQSDMVAHAIGLVAVGIDRNNPDTAQPRGGYDRLVKLLGAKVVHHKMDYFDPDVLNRMAHKVSNLDALLLKNPNMVRVGPDLGLKELETQMRKMSRELRNLKDRLAETAAAAGLPSTLPGGDHAMLAGKPLQGYRCLACDRPLEKLDPVPGPFMPNNQLAPKLQPVTASEKSTLMRQSKGGLSPEPSAAKRAAYDPSQRGPQQWYEGDQSGKPAEMLPKEDVGPKLAPGGWTRRTSNSGSARISTTGRSNSGLPDITQPAPWSPSKEREPVEGSTYLTQTPTLPAI